MRASALAVAGAVVMCSGLACRAGAPSCTYSVSLLEGYRAIGDPQFLTEQPAGALWTFRKGSVTGDLLLRIGAANLSQAHGYWGDPSQAFTVPTAGPIYSDIPAQNEVEFYRRAPSFTGVFLHPGFDAAHDSVAVFRAPRPMSLTALSLIAEDLGFFNGALVSAGVVVSGVETTLIMPTLAPPAFAPAIMLTPSSGLPVSLQAGDLVWVRTNNNGDASEDWMNVNMTMTFDGGPIVLAPPLTRIACPGASWRAEIAPRGGSNYRWKKGGADLFDGPTGTGSIISGAATPILLISNVSIADIASYSCRVVGACGEVTSVPVTPVLRCPGDADPDNTVNFADITAVLANFGAAYPPTIAGKGDADCSGTVNFADITAVLTLFGVACP